MTDGAVEFTDLYKAFFSGTRTVKVNVGYRYLTFTVVGTKKESSGGGIVQPEEEEKEEQKEEEQKEEEKEGDGKKESENPPEENPTEVTGTWHKNLKGWWYGFSDGTYAEDGWYKIDKSNVLVKYEESTGTILIRPTGKVANGKVGSVKVRLNFNGKIVNQTHSIKVDKKK